MKKSLTIITLMVFMIAGAAIYLLKPNQSQVTLAGFDSSQINIFEDYKSWPSSSSIDPTDTVAQTLYLAGDGPGANHSIVDINGDGLVDVVYHTSGPSWMSAGIFLNTGSNGFDLVYKCRLVFKIYYGDCAAL